ncbi:MAG: tail fiber domain-containing protein [Rhizobacter sp.]|nr:tail fiber domain-containing protein [Ferruginibacter sp.]
MKKILLFLLILVSGRFAHAQSVGIGTSTPNASAMLEINSANKGLLLPRVLDTSAVNTPAKGLIVYNNSNNKLWYYDGIRWQQAVANAGGMDSIWYKTKDTIAYTTRPYVGINTDLGLLAPQANLQVQGALLVQGKLAYSKATPTPAQTYTMTNSAGTQSIANTDSVFRLYDPGGTGNYNNNMQGNVHCITVSNFVGLKIRSEAGDWGLGTGDTLWISDQFFPACRTDHEYRFTAGSPNPADFIAKLSSRFIFRSNGDGANGKGFNFLITRLFSAEPATKINAAGAALYYNTGNSAFSAGINCEAGRNSVAMGVSSKADASSIAIGNETRSVGGYSVAIGYHTVASGSNAIAMGGEGYSVNTDTDEITSATGNHAVAIGSGVIASGPHSLALGEGSAAVGFNTVAIGYNTLAEGITSTAMGDETRALGTNSTAMGSHTSAEGDYSTSMGHITAARGRYSTAIGYATTSRGYAGTTVGMWNYPVIGLNQTTVTSTTPLFIVGNGDNGTNLNNAFTVLKNGNVGIGTQLPPVTKLQVVEGTDADLTNTSGYMVLGDANSTNLVMDNNEIMARNNGTNTTLFLQNGGGALETGGTASKPGGGSWSATSDARLKQNVQRYEDGLQQLQKINPVYFNYNQQSGYDTSKQFIGVLAQELKEVAPYMVGTFKKDNTEYLNVDNTAMTYMLINAVKEQQQQIALLKKENEKIISLELKIAAIEKMLISKISNDK